MKCISDHVKIKNAQKPFLSSVNHLNDCLKLIKVCKKNIFMAVEMAKKFFLISTVFYLK